MLPAGGRVFTMLDIAYVYMDIYLPTSEAGKVKIGADARITLDAVPDVAIPAKVAFIATQAQFTPKTVETKDERDKLMFRIRVKIDPERLRARAERGEKRPARRRLRQVRSGSRLAAQVAGARPEVIERKISVARIAGLTQRYGRVAALEEVSIEVPAGRMVGFIGPDGVGKSSLLSILAGARQIQSGSVFVLGGDMADAEHRAAVCPRIAYMPQGLGKNLYADLSVRENIEFFGRLFGQSRFERDQKIAELLESTGLAPFSDRPAKKLSGGMRQKLGLCCCLIHDPDLLILDEPTTGVDPLSRRQFWELIDRMRSRRAGMSVMVATAYMEEAERFDWLAAMNAGEVLATGSPSELKARTGAATLEEAFIALLPECERRDHHQLLIPPRRPVDGEPIIVARELTCRFGDFTAVDRVNFTIERGEIFGFLGSNGCGKTTTMKMLTGLLAPSDGEALLFGKPLEAGDMSSRYRVGYMSQSFSLYTELTVRQNLDLHAHLFHLPAQKAKARIAELVGWFGLEDYLDQRTLDLPLGIRQRLSLAVAIVHEPEILILDEPTSGVDPLARDRFWEALIDLSRKQGVTIFVSTHFMNEAARCDRIALMDSGRVLATGAPAELVKARNAATLEDAFISYLEEAAGSRAPASDAIALDRGRPPAPARPARRLPGSACDACSPTRSGSRWSCCATRSGSASACSALRF